MEARILHRREVGESYKAICSDCNMSLNTLKTHMHRIFVKTVAQSSACAIWNRAHPFG
ncbi:MAG: hypothetical protein IT579_12645 [Verrucomicrobia subdivision 3 bacterium]|nr:hypothetical protein [Limisphaerales bacterium]